MKIKYNTQIISGILFMIVGIILWLLIPSEVQTLEKTAVNAQTFPSIAISGIVIFSFGLLIEGILSGEKKEIVITGSIIHSEAFQKELKSVIFALMLIAYCVIVGFLGYVISTVLLVIAVMIFYGARKWYYYAIPLVTVGIVYGVFKIVLKISLP